LLTVGGKFFALTVRGEREVFVDRTKCRILHFRWLSRAYAGEDVESTFESRTAKLIFVIRTDIDSP
jgi:hypothetical protein